MLPYKIEYASKLFVSCVTIPLQYLGFRGWRVSFGLWLRFTKDRVVPTPLENPKRELHVYSPLAEGQIRLIELSPGNYADPLVARFKPIDADQARGRYVAISYVWGDGKDWVSIEIDGDIVLVPKSATCALRRARNKATTTVVWIDSVCINQADVSERMTQVTMMTKIYSQCRCVFAYLGEATEYSADGLGILTFLASDAPFNDFAPWCCMSPFLFRHTLHDIIDREYFKRIWVVQETALAPHVQMQVGDVNLTWDRLRDTRRFLARIKLLEIHPATQTGHHLEGLDLRPFRELLEQSAVHMYQHQGVQRSAGFLDIVHAMRHRKAGDPRDKLYGMAAFLGPGEKSILEIDYNEPYGETYQRFCDRILRMLQADQDVPLSEYETEEKAYMAHQLRSYNVDSLLPMYGAQWADPGDTF